MKTAACVALLMLAAPLAQAERSISYKDVKVSESTATSTGSWHYVLKQSAYAWACDESANSGQCLGHALAIVNQSAETLECRLHVDYRRDDGTPVTAFDAPMLVLPRTSPEVHSMISDDKVHAEVSQVQCLARAPYQRLAKVEGCAYDMMGKPFESYYPDEAKRRSLQGPVIVSFLLGTRQGPAREVALAQSSLVPMLDDAALRFIRDQEFRTACPGQRFDVLMRFKLRDEVVSAK